MTRSFRRLVALLALALLGATAASANRPVDQRRFALDPNLGYIVVRVGPLGSGGGAPMVYFVRVDREKHTALWSFGAGNIDSRRVLDGAQISGRNHWAVDGQTGLYVVPVNPGFWVVGGAGATTFSLGSYGFEVRAGEMTYVGTVLTGRQNGESPIPEIAASRLSPDLASFGTLMNIVMSDAVLVRPPAEGDALPAAITAFTVTRAELVPDVRFDNFLRALVNRALGLPPIGHMPLLGPGEDPFAPPAPAEAGPTTPAP
ncbi:MAG TPA: hypothetical protein VK614_12305 [Allosphingosinicella sp.]|nr:hypothetical protein [Allosphingosinicella sp.]